MSKRKNRARALVTSSGGKPRQGATAYGAPTSVVAGPGGAGGMFAYDAADVYGQETAEWNPWLRSPDTEINIDRDRMVARSRDLVRNDGWAAGGTTRITDSVVGSRFRLVAEPDYRALQLIGGPSFDATWASEFGRAVEAEWRMWADDPARHCDAGRRLTITQIFRVAMRHKVVDGDALAMMLWRPDKVGAGAARYATAVQLIDPDRLSNPYQQLDSMHMRGGVEQDQDGAPIAYHIRRAHQNDLFGASESMIWDRFPRETAWGRPVVVHDFDIDRAAQSRGLGVFTPVLSRMKMLQRYDRAELQQALLQTIFATFFESPYDPEDVANSLQDGELSEFQRLRTDYHQANPVMLGGVRVPVLPPGESVKTVAATRPNSGFDSFQHAFLRNVAAATGQSAEQVTWDYSQTNYSSARAAMLEAWRTLTRRRDDFSLGFAGPVYGAWLEEAIDSGRVELPKSAPDFLEMRAAYMRCRWIGPARGWVDPVAERQGSVLGLDAGFGTLEQECAEQGLDYEEVLDQRKVEVKMMKDRGLPLPQWAAGAPTDKAATPPQKPAGT